MQSDRQALLERAETFFSAIGSSPALAEIRKEADRKAQFVPISGPPFSITVNDGSMSFEAGLRYPADQSDAIHVIEIELALDDIFAGRLLIGEAIFHHKLQIPGYRNKEPELASLSRLLRFGIWQIVPGAEILRPAK